MRMFLYLSNFGGPGTEPPQQTSFFESELFAYLAIFVGCIVLIQTIKYYRSSNTDKIYREEVFNHLVNKGYNSITARKISKSDQQTINKFLEINEIVKKD